MLRDEPAGRGEEGGGRSICDSFMQMLFNFQIEGPQRRCLAGTV